MKKQFFLLLLVLPCIMSCASTSGNTQTQTLSEITDLDITGIEWKLIEARIDGVDTQFRRENQPEIFRDIYTLNFDGRMVSGTGAPNTYSAPYTLGEGQTISIMPMRSTLMAAFVEPENLTEHEFFNYLQGAHTWDMVNNNLVLNSRTREGRQVRLVFER